MTDLKPCPFCGKPGQTTNAAAPTGPTWFWACCSDDECNGWHGKPFLDQSDAIAAWNRRASGWMSIETAPTDGTTVLVYAPAYHGLPNIICKASYHPDGGWCVDELREPTHWMPLPEPPND